MGKPKKQKASVPIKQGNNPDQSTEAKDQSPYVFQRDKIDFELKVRELPWTEKQKGFISQILDKQTKCVFIEGPAGASKTSLAVYCGLQLLKLRKVSDVFFVRAAVESADSKIGYLPGDVDEKFGVYMAPFLDKIHEFLDEGSIKKLQGDDRFHAMPVNYVRGLHWAAKCIIVDECQSLTKKELITIITRLGEFSKIIFLGDPFQSDLPECKSGGFVQIANLFSDVESMEHGICHLKFTVDDIVRSEFVKFVTKKLEAEQHRLVDGSWQPRNRNGNGDHGISLLNGNGNHK